MVHPRAIRIGTVWGIPENEEKPADARIEDGKYIKKLAENEKWATDYISDSNSKPVDPQGSVGSNPTVSSISPP